MQTVILAYEPIWAIGTGDAASSQQIEEVHDFIRKLLISHFGQYIGSKLPILYGGSCNENNVIEILSNLNVNIPGIEPPTVPDSANNSIDVSSFIIYVQKTTIYCTY